MPLEGYTLVTKGCILCGELHSMYVPDEVLRKREDLGMKAQDAWPEGTREQWEFLISGSHSACYDNFMGDLD